ncbi:MAG: hypothetical protein WCJ56_08065 [bacterium]
MTEEQEKPAEEPKKIPYYKRRFTKLWDYLAGLIGGILLTAVTTGEYFGKSDGFPWLIAIGSILIVLSIVFRRGFIAFGLISGFPVMVGWWILMFTLYPPTCNFYGPH